MRQKVLPKIKLWAPPAIWAGFIFLFSSFPVITTTEIYWKDFILKKSAHIIEYGILAVLLYRAFKGSGFVMKKAILLAIVIAAIYGVTDEFHQSFTPGREPRIRDVVFDTIGASLGTYICKKYL